MTHDECKARIMELVIDHCGSFRKAALWLQNDNPLLGAPPSNLLSRGHHKKLLHFLETRGAH